MTTTTNKRVTLFMDHDIAIHARAQAVVEDLSLTDLVEKALLQYLPKATVIKKVKIKAGLDH
jgi:hypothetical protein